jgi:cell fate (sporulation/competence/biofilm development) regulator YlbF (YheA/YmcA/DUF963 family)
MKTLPQIAGELNIPVSTMRYRIKPYEDFITHTTTSKGKEYSDQSELIMREINTYTTQGKSQEEIMLLLTAKYARDIEIVQETTTPTTSEQQPQFAELVRLNDNLEKLMEKMDRQQELQMQINEMRTAISELSRVERHKKGFWSRLWG